MAAKGHCVGSEVLGHNIKGCLVEKIDVPIDILSQRVYKLLMELKQSTRVELFWENAAIFPV